MNFRKIHIIAGLTLCVLSGCGGHHPLPLPLFADGGYLKGAVPVPPASLALLAGRYGVSTGSLQFNQGDSVSVMTTPKTLSILYWRDDVYAVMRPGCVNSGSSLYLEGFWRFGRSFRTGLIRLKVQPDDYAQALCAGTPPPAGETPVLSGASGENTDALADAQGLKYQKALVNVSGRFNVIAHHGPCRTIDECGFSENSVEGIRNVESFGADWIELDSQLTGDGVPISYHDVNLTDRLSDGELCHGQLNQLPLDVIRAACVLKYGEQIPTLDEALTATIRDTALRGVWLDMKSADAVQPTIAVVQKAQALAQTQGRTITFLMGLPTPEVIAAFAAAPHAGVPCLIEENSSDLVDNGCQTWGPRFTRGALGDQVRSVQSSGGSVFFWTIDDTSFIDFFMVDVRANGIDTDRPGVLFDRAQINANAILAP